MAPVSCLRTTHCRQFVGLGDSSASPRMPSLKTGYLREGFTAAMTDAVGGRSRMTHDDKPRKALRFGAGSESYGFAPGKCLPRLGQCAPLRLKVGLPVAAHDRPRANKRIPAGTAVCV